MARSCLSVQVQPELDRPAGLPDWVMHDTLSHSEARADLFGEDERATIAYMRRIAQVQQRYEGNFGYMGLAQHGSV